MTFFDKIQSAYDKLEVFFFSRTVWKFLFQEQTRILFHEQSFNMFKNRQDLFQGKSGRFHLKNNWKFNFMKTLDFLFS